MKTELHLRALAELDAKMPGLPSMSIVGIVRRLPRHATLDAIGVAVSEGLRVVEVTLDSEEPCDLIAQAADAFRMRRLEQGRF